MGDFGGRLRDARERKGISLRQIAAATKISVGALEGLERNDISKLPGGIFSRAFVRSYAIEVGLDPDETVRYFLQQFGAEVDPAAQPAAPAVAPPPVKAPRRRAAPYAAPPPANVTDEVDFESKQRMAGVVLKLVLVSLPIAASILYFTSRGASRAAERGAAPEATAPAAQAPETTPPAAREVLPATAPPPAEATSPAAVEPASATVTSAAPAEPVLPAIAIEIAPSADCWTRLTIDGEVTLSRLIAAGQRERRQFRQSAVLQVGDAAACIFTLDGRQAAPLGEAGQVREVHLTRENYKAFLR